MYQHYRWLALILVLFAIPVQADGLRHFVSFGLSRGGDDLLTIATGGGTEEISAGGYFYASYGGLFQWDNPQLESQISLGYFFDAHVYSNGDASFERFPLEGLVFYKYSDKVRMGGGVTYHINPVLTCDITAICNGDVSFDDALGMVLQSDWGIGDGSIAVGLRYTHIEYTGPFGSSANGSNFGLISTFQF
jgi:hypothetical protein